MIGVAGFGLVLLAISKNLAMQRLAMQEKGVTA
jgi:hypothetical protein